MYTYTSKIGFSEIESDGYLGFSGILNYFQNCSEFHSETLNNGYDVLKETNNAWILNGWQINVLKRPHLDDVVKVSTAPHSMKGILAQRNFFITDENDDMLVCANSHWTFFDMKAMRPAKISEDQIKKYALDAPYPMDYAPRKIDLPKNLICKFHGINDNPDIPTAYCQGCFEVKNYMLDMNMHLNNAWFVTAAISEMYNNDGSQVSENDFTSLRIEYKQSAYLGDVIAIYRFDEPGRTLLILAFDSKLSHYGASKTSSNTGSIAAGSTASVLSTSVSTAAELTADSFENSQTSESIVPADSIAAIIELKA